MPDDPTDLLTSAEVARRLGICTRTLREHVNSGAITYVVVGRGTQRVRRMFTPADVEAFCDRRRRRDWKPLPEGRGTYLKGEEPPKVYDFSQPPPGRGAQPPSARRSRR